MKEWGEGGEKKESRKITNQSLLHIVLSLLLGRLPPIPPAWTPDIVWACGVSWQGDGGGGVIGMSPVLMRFIGV